MKTVDFDIVILALPRWDGHYSSTAYSLAQTLSVHTRVFYIDNPFTWKDFLLRRKSPQIIRRKKALLRGKERFSQPDERYPNLIAVTPELIYPNNWLPPGFFYDALSRVNDGIVNRTLKDLIVHFGVSNYIFINSFNPLFGKYFSGLTKPLLNIYHCVDDISKSVYVARHGTRLEAEMIRKADITLVTSMELKRLKTADAKAIYYLPNAANVELFQQSFFSPLKKPKEIESVGEGSRMILYMGNICHRLDYALLTKIAERFSNDVLVMVGPLSKDVYKKVGLDRRKNVLFTGSKKLEELPAFLRHCSCCIIPFALTPLTRSIYPLKINEYLSAGKPVVTTNFSDDIITFAEVAMVSASHEEFLGNLERALSDDSRERALTRIAFAAANNWTARASELLNIVKTHIDNDKRGTE